MGLDWGRGTSMQNIEDNLGMRVHEVGELATNRESLVYAAELAPFLKGPPTRR